MGERRALLDTDMYKISEEDSQDEEVLSGLNKLTLGNNNEVPRSFSSVTIVGTGSSRLSSLTASGKTRKKRSAQTIPTLPLSLNNGNRRKSQLEDTKFEQRPKGNTDSTVEWPSSGTGTESDASESSRSQGSGTETDGSQTPSSSTEEPWTTNQKWKSSPRTPAQRNQGLGSESENETEDEESSYSSSSSCSSCISMQAADTRRRPNTHHRTNRTKSDSRRRSSQSSASSHDSPQDDPTLVQSSRRHRPRDENPISNDSYFM